MGSSESVTIESDTGRLSEEEIERMLEEAERFAEEDRMATEKIQARNGLESYAYSLRGQLDDPEKLGDQPDADAEELKEAQEALQAVAQPIIGKLYEGGAPGEDEDFDDFDDHEEL